MSTEQITVSCFDINGEYNEEVVIDQSKNFLHFDSPIRIISRYMTEKILQNLSKRETQDKYTTKFSFTQEFEGNNLITINCDVISNFSVSHQSTFDSNGYIIFCDLEKNTTLELLEKIINYINDNCSIFIKTYIVGVFKDHIDEDKGYNEMKQFLKNLDLEIEFEYYEMFLGESDKFSEMKKKYENCDIMVDVFKNIFVQMVKGGNFPQIKKNNNMVRAIEDKSKIGCKIF